MSESRVRRLVPVVEMAVDEERKAAARLGESQKQVEDAKARLRDLEFYCSEYEKGWSQRGSQGVGRDWLLNYQRFMAQMQTAIEQQTQTVKWYETSLDKVREQWRQRYQRVQALRKLIERYRRTLPARIRLSS